MNTTWRLNAKDEGPRGRWPAMESQRPPRTDEKACNRDPHAYDVVPYGLTGAQFNPVVGAAQVVRDVDAGIARRMPKAKFDESVAREASVRAGRFPVLPRARAAALAELQARYLPVDRARVGQAETALSKR